MEPLAGPDELFRPDVRKKPAQQLCEFLRIGEIARSRVGLQRVVEDFVIDALFPAHHGIEPEFLFGHLGQHQLYIQPPPREPSELSNTT